MALDEVLLVSLDRPLLRHYRWKGKVATFGYAGSLGRARMEAPGFELVRRWTGGGVVRHDADWTFSLVVPAGHPLAMQRPTDSYCTIHAAVVAALQAAGIPGRLAASGEAREAASCFRGVAVHDALDQGGAKICGGAQRRSRLGLLHQGSLQGVRVPADFCPNLAARLSETTHALEPDPSLLKHAQELAASRYATAAWLERIA
jgi:lipoate-protein ligase A